MSIANPYTRGTTAVEIRNRGLRRQVTMASLGVAIVLIAAKLAAYMITDSVSVMTSLLDSTFDALASTVTLVSVLHAMTPADEEHRFGHGKVEALAAMGQSLFIFGSAAYLLFESMHRSLHPQPVKSALIGIGVMLLSVVLTVFLVTFQKYVVRRTGSVAISADHLHYKGDLLMNGGVLCALALGYFSGWPYYDPLFAAGISLVLLGGAWRISRESYGILMDRELSDAERTKIEALVMAHPQARAVHDLRTRQSGQRVFIEFHLELDGDLPLRKAHDVTEELERALYEAFPKAEVLIHQEPAGLHDHRLDDDLKAQSA
ncbi:MAG: cation diffusion facilitator family transporter [Alphaproteobacteria bacterium]|nr:cation diffusion facilitator family transporter [Alphaproteobacteria bacterium]